MPKKEEPTYYGGQAVMEGVMMRGRSIYAMAVRKPDGEITVVEKALSTKKNPALKWPIVRGVIAFGSSMVLGMSTLTQSAELAGALDDDPNEELSKFEQFLKDKLGDKLNDFLMTISVILSMTFAVGLFMLLPTWIGSWFAPLIKDNYGWTGVIEGVVRILIFVLYVYLISLSKEIKRVFQYHGAEHKTINCYEKGEELTVENVARATRLHKRCGTSFLFVVMIISMLVFMFVRTGDIWMRLGSRIVLLPLIAGLAYEVSVRWAGKYDNWLVRAVIFPGMCLQRITTAEPDEKQIETAIVALNRVLVRDGVKPESECGCGCAGSEDACACGCNDTDEKTSEACSCGCSEADAKMNDCGCAETGETTDTGCSCGCGGADEKTDEGSCACAESDEKTDENGGGGESDKKA